MTWMLARITTVDEAATALAGGVDRLVVRALPHPVLAAIGALTAGRCPVSLWWDDPAPQAIAALQAACAACGADEVWTASAIAVPGLRRRAVITLGDAMALASAAAEGCVGIVVDGGAGPLRLLATASIADLERQRRDALARGLAFGIAGPMEAPDVPRLLALLPDTLVMDDLLRREGNRSNPIDPDRVRLARDLMGNGAEAAAASSAIEPVDPDRIFVRDWTLSLRLGAYGHETAAQRVRFTVEAEVERTTTRATDMRDVVTYDLITDAIARATVGHVALVETIAEDVATTILAHPRVTVVDVTVEKLDLGPGALGCRIRRRHTP